MKMNITMRELLGGMDLPKLLEDDAPTPDGGPTLIVANECVVLKDEFELAKATLQDFPDRTAYECFVNRVHLPYTDTPESLRSCLGYVASLRKGLCEFVVGLDFLVIVSVSEGDCVVRFHQCRPSENWISHDLEGYPEEAALAIPVRRQTSQLGTLLHGEILHAPALPIKRKGFHVDLLLMTTRGNTNIVGEGFDLPDGEEVFFLNLKEYDPATYWVDENGRPAWPPEPDTVGAWKAIDLALDWKQSGLEAILAGNRQIRFYRNARDFRFGLVSKGTLQSAAAITLSGRGASDGQVLICATPVFPCSLEIVTEASRIRSILAELEEFYLTADDEMPSRNREE
jgi:hypothetical protein